jgi:hypothetical protein
MPDAERPPLDDRQLWAAGHPVAAGAGPHRAGAGNRTGERDMTGSRRDRVMAACTAKPGSVEDYPFGDGVAVHKVAGKMFALVPVAEEPPSISLKCDPDIAESWLKARSTVLRCL